MKRIFAVVVLAGLVAVPMTFAKDDAPAESKTAKKKKSGEHKGGKTQKKSQKDVAKGKG